MEFPYLNNVERYRETTNTFGGYNHQLSCQEGQFFDMKNMTSQYYPILSPRQKRGIVTTLTNPQGILDKEDVMWVDDGILYSNGKAVELPGITLSRTTEKTMSKMGAYVVIMPDKVWYNAETGECGYMESSYELGANEDLSISLCNESGTTIDWHDSVYYETNEPKNGDYMMSTSNGKAVLKVYSATTAIWANVATTYLQICAKGIGKGFDKGDGVKITMRALGDIWPSQKNVLVNEEEDGSLSTNTTIFDKTDDAITIIGITQENIVVSKLGAGLFKAERKVPEMSFITECNNRLWGCSKDGHEIYCCKLGDVKNWNCFQGISTDSWAVTIGSDGKFTGAITYLGYPMFFKEDGFVKIAVSGTGGHQTKETKCRGVQKGSEKSLAILNEMLMYKSSTCICAYNGSLPFSVSNELGEGRYYGAVAGTLGDRYYISMKDSEANSHLFVYDQTNGIWSKEDNVDVCYFCARGDDLYFIERREHKLMSVNGTSLFESPGAVEEKKFDWMAESGNIGYLSPDNKYVSRINVRISLEFGTNADFYIQYDSSGQWEHKFNMSGKGTRTFTIPVVPRRCDHFKYKIVGKGGCKIHSITKTIEQGSDM